MENAQTRGSFPCTLNTALKALNNALEALIKVFLVLNKGLNKDLNKGLITGNKAVVKAP